MNIDNIKKVLLLGVIALFIGLAFIPSFNAVSISMLDNHPPDIELQYKLEKYNDKWLYTFIAICDGFIRVGFTFDDIEQDVVVGPGPVYTWEFLASELIRGHTICAIAYGVDGNNVSDCIEFKSRSMETKYDDSCDCQSNGKTHLAEKLLNKLEKNEVLSNVVDLSNPQSDRPICNSLFETINRLTDYTLSLDEKLDSLTKDSILRDVIWLNIMMIYGIVSYLESIAYFLECW
jgi:hypothetical protein